MTRHCLIAVIVLAASFALLETCCAGLNNDTKMLLHMSGHMLYDGGVYRRWVTVNSPLFYGIYALPVMASVGFGLPVAACLHGLTAAFCVISLFSIRNLLRNAQMDEDGQKPWLAASAILLLVAPCAFHTYADREHYLFILALPWLLQMLLRLPPHPLTAAFATVGFCIKPYNLLLLPVMMLCGGPKDWTLKQKLLSPSTIAQASVIAANAVIICAFFSDYPYDLFVACKTYAAVAFPVRARVLDAGMFLAAASVLIAGVKPASRPQLLAFCLTMAVIYSLNAGWIYTAYLLCVPLLLLCPELWFAGWRGKSCAGIICAAAVLLASYNLQRDIRYTAETGDAYSYNHISPRLKSALEKAAGNDFVFLSVNLWSSNFSALHGSPHSVYAFDDGPWPLAWVMQHPGNPQATTIWQSIFVKPLVEALAAKPAPVIIADVSPGQNVNLFALLAKDGQVHRALAHYVLSSSINLCMHPTDTECAFGIWTVPH